MSGAPNWMDVEPALCAQLLAATHGLPGPKVHVLTGAELALAGAKVAQFTPAVHVVWSGWRLTDARADGRAARVVHTWLLGAAVRNVAANSAGNLAGREAGALAALVAESVMGWRAKGVAAMASPMRLAARQPGAMVAEGLFVVPLAFECDGVLRAKND